MKLCIFDLIRKWFKPPKVEVEITSESIKKSIDDQRIRINKRRERIIRDRAKIKEDLKLFPSFYPASGTEIMHAYDHVKFPALQTVLNELIASGEWEYVSVGTCRYIQRVK